MKNNYEVVKRRLLQIMPIKKKTFKGESFNVHMNIKFTNGVLSISGVEGALINGDCLGWCGQINASLMEEKPGVDFEFVEGWNNEMFQKLLDYWDKWHLNNLHAGCEHQRNLGWEKDGYEKHPSEPCPVCGYKFGSAWNKVEVPEEVIDWLFSLPPAKFSCAWVRF